MIISTNKGAITVRERDFSTSKKYIKTDIAKRNLIDLKKILDKNKVHFGLIYGTLLGAYREKNFIKHDYDTDLYVLEEFKQKLLDSLKELIDIGFEVCRFDGLILSVIRQGEYIDFYFFRKSWFFYRKNSAGLSTRAKFLENTSDYEFLGEIFQIPEDTENFLVSLYGKNWRVPIKNDISMNHHWYIKIRNYIRSNFFKVFIVISFLKKFLSKKR